MQQQTFLYNFRKQECSIKTHSSYNFEPQATKRINNYVKK